MRNPPQHSPYHSEISVGDIFMKPELLYTLLNMDEDGESSNMIRSKLAEKNIVFKAVIPEKSVWHFYSSPNMKKHPLATIWNIVISDLLFNHHLPPYLISPHIYNMFKDNKATS